MTAYFDRDEVLHLKPDTVVEGMAIELWIVKSSDDDGNFTTDRFVIHSTVENEYATGGVISPQRARFTPIIQEHNT